MNRPPTPPAWIASSKDAGVTRARTRRAYECERVDRRAGFTLIELLVAMVIATIVLAGVGKVLIDAFHGSSTSITGQAASQRVLDATDRIRQDIQAIRATGRNADTVRDSTALLKGLSSASGTVTSQDPDDSGALVDVRDVLLATGTQLRFRADVSPGAAPGIAECVEYRVIPATVPGSTMPGWRVQRAVTAEPAAAGPAAPGVCAPAAAASFVDLLPPQVLVGPFPNDFFSYRLQCNNSGGMPCAGGGSCNETVAAAPAGVQMNEIVAILVNVSIMSSRGESAPSRAAQPVRMSIRSREDSMYREVLGCD